MPDEEMVFVMMVKQHEYWRISKNCQLAFGKWSQGCIRPRPSPFWRPSTRYNGISDPLRGGGVDCRISARGGVSIAGLSDFRARITRNGAESANLFWMVGKKFASFERKKAQNTFAIESGENSNVGSPKNPFHVLCDDWFHSELWYSLNTSTNFYFQLFLI